MDEKEGSFTELTLDEVLQILNLIEKSDFDFLQLEVGDIKLTVSKRGSPEGAAANPPEVALSSSAPASKPAAKAETRQAEPKAELTQKKPQAVAVKPGTAPIAAPMVGKFYTTPAPGAPPFVKVAKRVDEDTTVGLIEVMKVFNAIKSGLRGVIAEICVENGQFVEYGQTLFLVRPDKAPQKKGKSR